METTQHGLLEELVMAPRREHETKFTASDHQYFPSTEWSYESSLNNYNDSCLEFNTSSFSYSQLMMLTSQVEPQATFASCPSNVIQPYFSTYTPPFQVLDQLEPTAGHDVNVHRYNNSNDTVYNFKERYSCSSSRDERELSVPLELPVFSIGTFEDERRIRNKAKKLEGQPSKNLMAERRRRKRLNDRLSMLRSVVPRISKMDRTSILGDTIDYMKELLEKIHKLKMKDTEANSDLINSLGNLEKLKKISEATAKDSSRFDVRRTDKSTKIDISCPAKTGMVLSTLNTIETLGLDIQQCVVSCFNDFSLEASCSEDFRQRSIVDSSVMKILDEHYQETLVMEGDVCNRNTWEIYNY